MTEDPPLVRALKSVLGFLERQRTDYMLMGGMAVRTLALPRPTFDLVLQVATGEADAKAFAQQAAKHGYAVDEPHLRGFVDHLQGLSKIAMSVPAAGFPWTCFSAAASTSAWPSQGDGGTTRISARCG